MKVKLRNSRDTKLKVLTWVCDPKMKDPTGQESGGVLAVCIDANGQIETYGIDDIVGEKNFEEIE